jgi:NADPH-dependent glutamate synthase beta subunit-like oxidoreductase
MISDLNIRIDPDLCFACGVCVDRCIMDNLRLAMAPCRQACPLNLNCQGYVRLLAQGKGEEAARELRKHTPFGGILARICSRPCEDVCERQAAQGDGAVNIRALKRYLTDSYAEICYAPGEIAPQTGQQAGVVGSGPAGLAAAYELRSRGHEVTVFEAFDQPGGFLRQVIPAFRMPAQEVDKAVELLEKMGVEFRTGQALGRNLSLEGLESDFGAVVVAIGAGKALELGVPGEDQEDVVSGLGLLSRVRQGDAPDLRGRRVAVIGGGNTAVDCAITCRRLGADQVTMICLEGPGQMPAYAEELNDAQDEGVNMAYAWAVRSLAPGFSGIELTLARCLSVWDKSGRFSPQIEENGPLHSLEADLVVVAIGQEVETELLPEEMQDKQTGFLAGAAITQQSPGRNRVLVCGDCLSGPSSMVHALASGKEAAISADRLLRGQDQTYNRDYYEVQGLVPEYQALAQRALGGPRTEAPRLETSQRVLDKEWNQTLSAQAAKAEAERCLSCGRAFEFNQTCWYCLPCEIECPVQALEVRMPYQVR